MFDHLAAEDEIVTFCEYRFIGVEERIVQVDSVAQLAQHVGDYRSGTSAEIQTCLSIVLTRIDELDQWADELLVADVGNIVVVGVVLAQFGIGGEKQLACQEDSSTIGTPEVSAPRGRIEEVGVVGAQWARLLVFHAQRLPQVAR